MHAYKHKSEVQIIDRKPIAEKIGSEINTVL